ncbi:cell cycle protein [Synergistales bacterium]|nr:cell cycle protein [Synergistales bacterium]
MSSESYRIDYWDSHIADSIIEPEESSKGLIQDFAEDGWSLRSNSSLWIIPLILNCFGILMIASLTSQGGSGITSPYGLPFKQLLFFILGFVSMLTICVIPLAYFRRMSGFFWVCAMLLVGATLIPGLGVKVGGARRWLNLGFIQFQPLEILTLAVTIHLAKRLGSSKLNGEKCFLKVTLLIWLFSVLFLFFQPNFGGIILLTGICMSMHVVNRGWKYPLRAAIFLLLFFALMIYTENYRMWRLWAFLNPWDDPMKKGFQIIQGLVAFNNGGVLGMGLGKGLQKLNYLPAAHTDYIFPVIGEEFGLVGTFLVLALYSFWAWKCYQLYRRSRDPSRTALIWGMTVSILFPLFINLGGVMKLLPLSGIPLPFVSAGGTALVFMWVRVGFLLRIGKELTDVAARHEGALDDLDLLDDFVWNA